MGLLALNHTGQGWEMNQELIGELYTRHNFQMGRSCYNSCTMWSQWCNCQMLGCRHSFPKFHPNEERCNSQLKHIHLHLQVLLNVNTAARRVDRVG